MLTVLQNKYLHLRHCVFWFENEKKKFLDWLTENWQGRGSVLRKAFNGRFSALILIRSIQTRTTLAMYQNCIWQIISLVMSKTVFASHIKTDFSLSDSHHKNSFDPRPRIELGNRYESKHIIGQNFSVAFSICIWKFSVTTYCRAKRPLVVEKGRFYVYLVEAHSR